VNNIVDVHSIDRAHAKLSASGSKKWITCTPSAHLEDMFPDEDTEFSAEGTFAHDVFAYRMEVILGQKPADLAKEAGFRENKYWSQELSDYVQQTVNFAMEHVEAAYKRCKDPVILVEQRLDFSPWVPEGFGTGDLVIITDGLVEVLDLKYGKGIPVSGIENSQMRLYGLGGYNALAYLYDITHVRTVVMQPRLDNWGSEDMTADELLAWANEVVVPAATLAWRGKGEFVAGEHCSDGFCKARFTCKARMEQSMEIARREFTLVAPELLTTEQVCQVLDKADAAIKWLKDVQDFAFKEAERGVAIPGWKLVEGRSNRKYVSQDKVAARLIENGVPEAVIYERSLLGITAMEKAIGKKKFAELLEKCEEPLIEKPDGKPTLVPESDKRSAINAASHFTAIAETEAEPAAQQTK